MTKQQPNILFFYTDPTLCKFADVDYDPNTIHGNLLVPLLENRDTSWRDSVFVEFGGVNNTAATTMITCRHGNLKYGYNAGNIDELLASKRVL